MRTARALAEEAAIRLGRVEGVAAVALGGSWARRVGLANSNIDISIYYRGRLEIERLREVAGAMDDHHAPEVLSEPGERGPWVNEGARIHVRGRQMDWYYRDLDRVAEAIRECRAGDPACESWSEGTDSLCNYIYMGEVHYCRPLYDPADELARLKQETREYPPLLKRALIKKHLTAANIAILNCQRSAERGDTLHVAGALYRCARSLVQTLYALNGKYFVTERGAVRDIDNFLFRPPRFVQVVDSVLSSAGEGSAELTKSVRRLRGLMKAVQKLCSYYGPPGVAPRGA